VEATATEGTMNLIAQLTISQTANGGHRYELRIAGHRIWLTHAPATVVGRAGARARMERWRAAHPHEVRRAGVVPPVAAADCDEQEFAFWSEFEHAVGWQLWMNVEQLLGRRMKRPDTIAGWRKAFEAVELALSERKAGAA
jgi:hypothetical protein